MAHLHTLCTYSIPHTGDSGGQVHRDRCTQDRPGPPQSRRPTSYHANRLPYYWARVFPGLPNQARSDPGATLGRMWAAWKLQYREQGAIPKPGRQADMRFRNLRTATASNDVICPAGGTHTVQWAGGCSRWPTTPLCLRCCHRPLTLSGEQVWYTNGANHLSPQPPQGGQAQACTQLQLPSLRQARGQAPLLERPT